MLQSARFNNARLEQLKVCPIKKYTFPVSQAHFLLTFYTKEYLCFVGETSVFIVTFEHGKLLLQQTLEIPPIEVLDFASSGNGDLNILHQNGIYRQYIDQLLQGVPFLSY
jgi:hypothetical protein